MSRTWGMSSLACNYLFWLMKDQLLLFHVGFVVLVLFKKSVLQLAYFIHMKSSVMYFHCCIKGNKVNFL